MYKTFCIQTICTSNYKIEEIFRLIYNSKEGLLFISVISVCALLTFNSFVTLKKKIFIKLLYFSFHNNKFKREKCHFLTFLLDSLTFCLIFPTWRILDKLHAVSLDCSIFYSKKRKSYKKQKKYQIYVTKFPFCTFLTELRHNNCTKKSKQYYQLDWL